MASLRLSTFLSTTHFSTQPYSHSLSPPPHSLSLSTTTSPSFSHLSSTLSIKPPKPPTFFVFNVSSSSSTIEASETEQSETVEEEEEEEFSTTRLLASNVPWSCTADDIRPLFEKYGTVVEIELSMYNKTRNRGLAFVSMSSPEEALAAFNNLESYEFEGRTMRLNWAKPKKKRPPPPEPKPKPIHNLYVANLPFQARAKDLKEFFNSVTAEIIFNDTPRRPAGYGFVSFNSKAEADAALTAFQGKVFMERSIRVARSRKFLRREAVESSQSENNSDEQSEKVDEV